MFSVLESPAGPRPPGPACGSAVFSIHSLMAAKGSSFLEPTTRSTLSRTEGPFLVRFRRPCRTLVDGATGRPGGVGDFGRKRIRRMSIGPGTGQVPASSLSPIELGAPSKGDLLEDAGSLSLGTHSNNFRKMWWPLCSALASCGRNRELKGQLRRNRPPHALSGLRSLFEEPSSEIRT